jgi:hypothetical protein
MGSFAVIPHSKADVRTPRIPIRKFLSSHQKSQKYTQNNEIYLLFSG